MSTPDQPESPQLTRRQLREIRNTASTPIITPEEAEAAAAAAAAPVPAPLPRAAEPAPVAEEPPAASDVDLEAPALTRRAARQQERLRTASVPVIAETNADAADEPFAEGDEPVSAALEDDTVDVSAPVDDAAADDSASVDDSAAVDDAATDDEAVAAGEDDAEPDASAEGDEQSDRDVASGEEEQSTRDAAAEGAQDEESSPQAGVEEAVLDEEESPSTGDAEGEPTAADVDEAEVVEDAPRPVVAPSLGSGLLAGEAIELELPASFDQLLTRGSTATGALSASNALILSQTPDTGSIISPVTATGEVLVTGTFNLPESFGSTGTSHGSSDGKEIDAVLVDGELPAASSPTPIAASSAISTIKSADDIIKPPAPEKSNKLMVALGITAGALALALIGVLIVALVQGAI